MKKCLALLMALLMAMSVVGCAESLQQIEIPPLPEVTPTPEPSTIVTEPYSPVSDPTAEPGAESTASEHAQDEAAARILVNIGNTTLLENDPENGEELILTFSYDMPRVYSEENPQAAERVNEALATLEETFYTGDSYGGEGNYLGYSAMLEAAEDNYTYVKNSGDSGQPLELSDTLTAKVLRADGNVLSVLYTESVYTGGVHGSYAMRALNFDMTTGEALTLDRLSPDQNALEDELVRLMLELAEQDEDGYFSERISDDFLPEGGREEAFRALLREGSWCFDRDGLSIFSTLYELGPYAAGIVEFHIPYSALEGKIDSRWLFPADRQGKGSLSVCELKDVEGGDTEIVDKLTVNVGGEELCIVVEGRIYDVSVTTVYYVDRFYENTQLWYASALSNCALQLEVVVPEGLPNLLITYYTADGERHGKLLSQSGQDGSFMLVDDNIEAVG